MTGEETKSNQEAKSDAGKPRVREQGGAEKCTGGYEK